jgi:hypothetical protein
MSSFKPGDQSTFLINRWMVNVNNRVGTTSESTLSFTGFCFAESLVFGVMVR